MQFVVGLVRHDKKKEIIENCRIATGRTKSKQTRNKSNLIYFRTKKFGKEEVLVWKHTWLKMSQSWCFLSCYEFASVSIE